MANTTTTISIAWSGRMFIKAGTPIDANSKFANDGTAVGIVAQDVIRGAPTATVITAGKWNEDYSASNAGIRLTDACKRALSAITFVDDDGTELNPPELIGNATTEKAGVVKMAASVADSDEETSPTTAEFNALLASLRTAGILAPVPVPPETE